MQSFFYICEYLRITPQQFFDEGIQYPAIVGEFIEVIKDLNEEQVKHLLAIAKALQRKYSS